MFIQSLSEGSYFHIYNRGINGTNIFREQRNYYYFLHQYQYYCATIFDTFAYALLKNHFHLLVCVKENVEVPNPAGTGTIQLNASKQLSHFFNAYAQAVNKSWKRTGALFDSPFKRKLVEDEAQLNDLVYYCHYNPRLHGFVKDFNSYEFTSYQSILKNEHGFLASQKGLDWFGGAAPFQQAHFGRYQDRLMTKFIIE